MLNPAMAREERKLSGAGDGLLTIGMPVYNGAQWLRQALDSLLGQTFADFVLIVCDNASTDETASIVREIEEVDSRVRYHRNPENIGVYRNYNKVFSFANSKYFKWASSNDICAPTFLEECLVTLEENPGTVLAYPGTTVFHEDIGDGQQYRADPDIADASPAVRFRRALGEIQLNNALNGVIRTSALRGTLLNRVHAKSDVALIAELALVGAIRRTENHLFFRRMDPSASSSAKDLREAERFFAAEGRDIHRSPSWDYYRTCFRMALRAQVSLPDRMRCCGYVMKLCLWDRRSLWRELTGRGSR